MARPSSFTPEIAEEICDRLSEGQPLREICRDEHMPAWRTVYDWIAANSDFSARIARAREAGFDLIAAECLEIADDGSADYKLSDREGQDIVVDSEHIQRSKLRVETRLKLLAKWSPQKYGERVTHGGDPDAPIRASVEVRFV